MKKDTDPLLRWFAYDHLPKQLQRTSAPFAEMAKNLCKALPASAERTVALRKLLESKDAAVRAHIASHDDEEIEEVPAPA